MLYIKDNLKPIQISCDDQFLNNETVWAELKISNGRTLRVGVVYRPPNLSETLDCILYNEIKSLTNDSTDTIIMGDFNLPLINWNTNQHGDSAGDRFFSFFHENFLHQHVHEPTRDNNILDLVISTDENLVNYLEIGEPLDTSDHNIIRGSINVSYIIDNSSQKIPNFKRADFDRIRHFLNDIDWDLEFQNKNASEMFQVLKCKLHECTTSFIPFKSRRLYGTRKPRWMSPDLQRLIARKKKLYKKFKQTQNVLYRDEFRIISRNIKKTTKTDRKTFERKLSVNSKHNPKEFYAYVRDQRKTKESIGPLLDQTSNQLVCDDKLMAGILNKQFTSVFTVLPNNISPPSAERHPNCPEFDLSDLSVTENQILKIIDKLKATKSPGPDNIYARLIKETKNIIISPLSLIFNESIKSGVIPEDWKLANVTPIFKKGDKRNAANYRPISLTSLIGKILETVVRDKIEDHLEKNKLIRNSQHGFRKNHSCLTNLLEFFEVVSTNVHCNKPFDIIYLDFEKAFDKVSHTHLINKVESLGITGNLSRWIKEWLSHRSQRVVINGTESTWSNVTSGVPQGSVLGPLLFLIYINDIDSGITSNISKFADDTKLGGVCRNHSEYNTIQDDLNKLGEWSKKWFMSFNANKCKVMHLGKNNLNFKYKLFDTDLEVTSVEKDLGVLISNDLKPSKHCDTVSNKANKILGLINRTFLFKDEQTILKLYKSLVRPHLEYAQQFWCPSLQKDMLKLESVQRRATKLIPSLRSLPYNNRLKKSNLFSLKYRRLRGDLIELYKIVTNTSALSFEKYFNFSQTGLRSNGLKLEPRKKKGAYFFTRVTPHWNALHSSTVSAPSLSSFKKRLDKELVQKHFL